MERIIITEEDLTTNITSVDSTDVVYVPGFSTAVTDVEVDSYVTPEPFEPTLCTSVAQFEACFGKTPASFAIAQDYPIRDESVSDSKGFPKIAIPEATGGKTNTWFNKDDPDPSYIFAKELLLAGIPVIYERVNGIQTESFTVQDTSTFAITLKYKPIALQIFAGEEELSETKYAVSEKQITFYTSFVEGTVIKVNYTTNEDVTVENMYNALATILFDTTDADHCKIVNKDYQVKYITTGGYPSFEYNYGGEDNVIVKQMVTVAQTRGDSIALIDHTNKPERALTGSNSVFAIANGVSKLSTTNDLDTYAAMITPWANYTLTGTYTYKLGLEPTSKNKSVGTQDFGGAFAYLTCLAKSLKSNPNWYAVAGATRGLVPNLNNLRVNKMLTNAIANNYQEDGKVCINAITNIKPYGYCIWGNRTMRDQSSATRKGYAIGFLNLRNLVCDVKKQAHLAAQSLMFEQNTDVLWINFKSLMTPLLDKMVSGSGLSGYKIVKVSSDSKTKLKALIKIYPIYAVEQFEIAVQITDEEVSVQ